MEAQFVKCNICNSDEFDIIIPEGKAQRHKIVKCKKCGLMYANPQIHDAFDDNGDITQVSEEILINYKPENDQYLRKQYVQMKDYVKVLDFIEPRNKGNLMEVGSHAGVFSNEAKQRGWNVTGVEPLKKAALYSRKTFGLNIFCGPFEKVDIKAESMSVIVSFHVIEHVYDPKAFILKAYNLLEKGGLLILETPTYDSLNYKILRHRERNIKCHGHIYFFTRKTLRKLVESNNFKVVKHELVGRNLTIGRLLTRIGMIFDKKNYFDSLIKKFNLEKFTLKLNMRDIQRIYCEKI